MNYRKQMTVDRIEHILRRHGVAELDRHPEQRRAAQGYLFTSKILPRVEIASLKKSFAGFQLKVRRERFGTTLHLGAASFKDRGRVVRGFSQKEIADALHERFNNPLHNFLRQNPGLFVHGVTASSHVPAKRHDAIAEKLEKILTQGIVSTGLAERAKLRSFVPEFDTYVRRFGAPKLLAEIRPDMRADTVWIESFGTSACHQDVQGAWGASGSAKILLDPSLVKRVVDPNPFYAARFSRPSWFRSNYRYVKRRIPAEYVAGIVLPNLDETKSTEIVDRLKRFNKPIFSHEGKQLWAPNSRSLF